MKRLLNKLFLGLLMGSFCCLVQAKELAQEHVVWKKLPIAFEIPLHQERILSFGEPVTLIEGDLTDQDVRLTINDGSVYMKALREFETKRTTFRLNESGKTIIVDVSSNEKSLDDSILNVIITTQASQSNEQARTTVTNGLNYISLTRFAIQSLYAPERLLETPSGIARAPMLTQKNIVLVYGDKVLARPLISWQGGGLFVTAVLVKNKLHKPITLDPRMLVGNWQTAAFYPSNTLQAMGSKKDSVTVFVTSSIPFGKALYSVREV